MRPLMISTRTYLDAIMKDRKLTSAQRELLRVLVEMRDKDGIVVPQVSRLTDHFNLTETPIYNRIDKAVTNGYLREVRREGRQRYYEMILPSDTRTEEIATLEDRVARLERDLQDARDIGTRLRVLETKVAQLTSGA